MPNMNMLNTILLSQAKRKEIVKRQQETILPLIVDEDAESDHKKKLKKLRKEYASECAFVDYHIDLLRKAMELSGTDAEYWVCIATDHVPLTVAEAERLKKMNGKPDECEGQMTLFEQNVVTPTEVVEIIGDPPLMIEKKCRVSVKEDPNHPGTWCILVDDQVVEQFFETEALAWEKAPDWEPKQLPPADEKPKKKRGRKKKDEGGK